MARVSGCEIELNLVTPLPTAPDGWRRTVEFAHQAEREGGGAAPDVRGEPAALRAREVSWHVGSTPLPL